MYNKIKIQRREFLENKFQGGYIMKFKKITAGLLAFCLVGLPVNLFPMQNLSVYAVNTGAAEEFLLSGYDAKNITFYDGTEKVKHFSMNGRTYYQGLVANGESKITYDVSGVNALSFTVGHVDGAQQMNVTFTIYLDGKAEEEYRLTPDMNLLDVSLDVSDASEVTLNIASVGSPPPSYGLGDFRTDAAEPNKPCVIPDYSTAEEFVASGFYYDIWNEKYTPYTAEEKTKYFKMDGRTYHQGIIIKNGGYASFNTENADKISFTLGRIDNTQYNGTLNVYLDGKQQYEIPLDYHENLADYEFDVSDTAVIRFEFNGAGSCGLGDVSIDDKTPVQYCDIPEYTSTAEWITDGFDANGSTVYDGTEPANNFSVDDTTYSEGIVFEIRHEAEISFNTEKLSEISFTIGCIDKTKEATLTVYYDNKATEEYTLTADMSQKEITLDVSDVSVTRLYFSLNNYATCYYALTDFNITSKGAEETEPETETQTETETETETQTETETESESKYIDPTGSCVIDETEPTETDEEEAILEIGAETITITRSELEKMGYQVPVYLKITQNPGIRGLEFTAVIVPGYELKAITDPEEALNYGGEVLSYQMVSAVKENQIKFSWANAESKNKTGNVALLLVTFPENTTSGIADIFVASIWLQADVEMTYQTYAGRIQVISDEEAETTTEETESQSEEILSGDADGNGTINILDVISINKAILGKETLAPEQLKAIDFNHNDKPDSEESLTILKYIVGLVTSLTE